MLNEARIDTLHMVAKLKPSEMEEVYLNVNFDQWKGNKRWKHCIYQKENGYFVFFDPVTGSDLWLKSHYNILVVMQHDAICNKPALLKYLFSLGEWRIKRMDTAFDWLIPMSKHFILKPANVLLTPMKGNSNYYLYGKRSEVGVCMYDKKLQLLERKGESITESNLIRLELRIKPRIKHQRIMDGDLSWLKRHFDKIVFVPDASSVSRSLERDTDKQAFRNIRRRQRQDWTGIDRQTRKRIREAVRSHAVDLFELFLRNNLHKDVFWQSG